MNLVQRIHTPIYWTGESNEIRRTKWFYSTQKNQQFIPCDEATDQLLEVELPFFYKRTKQIRISYRICISKHVISNRGIHNIRLIMEKNV